METLPVPVLAELLAMLPYREIIKCECLSRSLHTKLTENASLVAAFIHMRCEVPEHVHVTKASFVQLKAVLRTLNTRSDGIPLLELPWSCSSPMDGIRFLRSQIFSASLCHATHVITSLSLYKAASNTQFTAVLFVSYEAVGEAQAVEQASLFAQTQSCEAVSEMESAGLLSVSACYDYESEWKAVFLRAPYRSEMRPVLWLQVAPDFFKTVTLVFTRPLLARFVYLFLIDSAHSTPVHLSMRGAEMTLLAS